MKNMHFLSQWSTIKLSCMHFDLVFNACLCSFFAKVGLCHVSGLSDDHIDKTKYRAGERVTAKILKVYCL